MNQLMNMLASAGVVWVYVLGALSMLLAVGISVLVAMQSTKEDGLSSAIAGSSGADNFFGKSKTLTKDRLRSRITLILSIVFVVLVLVLTILTSNVSFSA